MHHPSVPYHRQGAVDWLGADVPTTSHRLVAPLVQMASDQLVRALLLMRLLILPRDGVTLLMYPQTREEEHTIYLRLKNDWWTYENGDWLMECVKRQRYLATQIGLGSIFLLKIN